MNTPGKMLTILLATIYFIIPASSIFAQLQNDWVDIYMQETAGYTNFSVNQISNDKHPPQNLFDADLDSFWLAGAVDDEELQPLYMELPRMDDWVINIFAGSGHNEKTFHQYARPRKLHFTLYVAINPEGHVTEHGALYKALKFPHEHTIFLANQFDIQSLNLNFTKFGLENFEKQVYKRYVSEFEERMYNTAFILQMEILEVFPGKKYDDIVISQIYFNDCIPSLHTHTPSIEKVYLNAEENTFWAEDAAGRQTLVHKDTTSVLQILDVSPDHNWAVLISMPDSPDGRAETTYLLANIYNQEIVNTRLEESTGNYLPGTPMYLESKESGDLHLFYFDQEGREQQILLR